MAIFFYHIFLGLYAAGLRVVSFTNKKAALWLSGRKGIFDALADWRKKIGEGEKVVWMHCASLGEFEQGRPVLEKIRQQYPSHKILLSFFSPSGYEVRKNYEGADGIFYLPLDGKFRSKKFIETIQPSLVVWIKYEYWYYYLTILKKKNIPVLLVSAIFRKDQPFFKSYGGWWKKMLHCFAAIFVQDENSAALLSGIGISSNVETAGDTRFDRVIAIAEQPHQLPDTLINFCRGHKVIVAGSTWEEDEEELVHYVKIHPEIKFIIAPHEIDAERLNDAKKLFGHAVFYSGFNESKTDMQVLIIDNIGMLSKLYSLADITYVGGGFNASGIHNILEAGVHGKPVIFGPQYEKFKEARDLVEKGGAFPIENALELEATADRLFSNDELLLETAAITKNYIYDMSGATEKVMDYIYRNRLLTN